MAINLTYDPSNDPATMEAEDQRDSESLEIGEQLAEQEDQLLAGKYKDAEELEKAYIELQQKLGSNEDTTEEGEAATETVDEVSEPEDLDLENLFPDDDEAQRVFNVAAELSENGEISSETMEAIGDMSGQEVVDAYARIAKAGLEPVQGEDQESEGGTTAPLTNEDIDSIQNAVGGEDAYTRMTQWAGENFTPQEIQAYDAALESGDLNQINLGLQALYYRYQDAVGYEGDMVQGKAAQAVEGFRSQAEVVRAMGDPRYEDDPAYRQDVYDKLERSNIQF
tara:strand:- start:156 stop:998 length:843 start_codon:yes stop_codon:yes gene_type:complete